MPKEYEIHFQEGFKNDRYELLVEGKCVGSGSLTTRNQIALADIAKIEAAPGKQLTIKLPGTGEIAVLKLPKSESFLLVNKKDNQIATEWTDTSPGYV